MSTYITKSGDTFDLIAFNVLGHRRFTKDLMEANTNHLDTVIFSAGVVLNIPAVDTVINTNTTAPPWVTA